jgi:hypothetical protein
MSDAARVYEFVFRGLLTEEALDKAGRTKKGASAQPAIEELEKRLALDLLEPAFVSDAQQMSIVYTAVAAFENATRDLISRVLLEQVGETWWETCVPESVRKRAESRLVEEAKIRWHGQRGESPITYTELGDLAAIIRNSWPHFKPHIPSIEWAASIFAAIERSRNVIMHSGFLSIEDVERVGINIRDWMRQVGT